ncbi:MAG: MATE family efflux transporter [Butyribacter sp.]|nr:MATE family efflux transporter [bacterium]MDY3854821.1 MATE family efflux transporter [Butyribacter sp.]
MTAENKQFYRKVAVLVLPIAAQNLINTGISSIDVIMLGKVGEKVLSGASLGAQIQFIMSLILFGLTSGASVLMAQYWGKRDYYSIETVFGIAAKLAVIVSLFFTIITFCIPEHLMMLFTSDKEVIAQGTEYLRIVCFSYLVNALTMVYLNSMRNLEKVVIATVVYLISMVTNILVNAVLIFGMFGMPEMGIAGAAIGTVVARMIEFLIVIIYDRKFNDVFQFHWEYLSRKNKLLWKDFARYSAPVVANELMWGLGMSAMAAILGHMGSQVTAANSVAQVARNLATVVAFGVASAAAIIIGNTIGEGKIEQARRYGRKFIGLAVVTGILGGIVILCIRPVLLTTMTLTADAQKYLSFMLLLMALYVVAQALNTTLVVGIFRGGGDTKFGFFLDASIMWGISILGGALAAFVFHASVYVVILFVLCDEEIKVPIALLRYKTHRWLQNVTRD